MQFTNVYDGEEHINVCTVDVDTPPADVDDVDELFEWAEDNIWPHSGDGNAVTKDAGYFADILACPERPDLVGKEFSRC